MTTSRAIGYHDFSGSPSHGGDEPPLRARPICRKTSQLAIYGVDPICQQQWKNLWPRLFGPHRLRFSGPPPGAETQHLIIVFCGAAFGPPLCLKGRPDRQEDGQFVATTATPPLSWRLAAVELAQNLPRHQHATAQRSPSLPPCESTPELPTGIFRLRPDLRGPASTFAPTEPLREVTVALRSRHCRLPSLLQKLGTLDPEGIDFVRGLIRLGVIIETPRPFRTPGNAFDYLSLHWSAHDPQVRRRYRRLSNYLDGVRRDYRQYYRDKLDEAFDVLHRPDGRRKLRFAMLKAPVISEVTDYYHRRLQRARRRDDMDDAIDSCRRILELNPSDRHARALLRRLLCVCRTPVDLDLRRPRE